MELESRVSTAFRTEFDELEPDLRIRVWYILLKTAVPKIRLRGMADVSVSCQRQIRCLSQAQSRIKQHHLALATRDPALRVILKMFVTSPQFDEVIRSGNLNDAQV